MRDRLLALLILAVLVAGAFWLRRFAWLGLFGAIMLPLLLAASLLPLVRGWIGKWACLLAATACGTAVALPLYHAWSAALAAGRLPDLQLLACAFGISTAILGLPQWQGQIRQRAAQMASLRHAALAAELKALQAQVEPHFLYNTLANARYLARNDPERAAQMLEHLIAYLHSALPDLRAEASTVGRECELAGHYLALMQVRFGARLLYMVDCPPALALLPMPPLLLMTLVENAVQHGVEPQPGVVAVSVEVELLEAGVRIRVSDDGAGIGQAVLGSGVGLRNLRERLKALYAGRATFQLAARAGGGADAVLVLPA
ncbi:sensor histidine kinase [Massilia sp. S19_KUP03_FR1]|uniref:sensor histidine kinase n=1 Tax=Massilia sp. S19_KUP03_FR1 TaxID=3025503 RepID=UPI002FCDB47C